MKENEKNSSLADLREFMIQAKPKTVQDWNQVRERAKLSFTGGAISALDGSGLINRLIKPSNNSENGDE